MTTPNEPERLEPLLRQVESELAQHLQEACESESSDLREESTGELFKLEETLFAAARAAEQAVEIRRRMRQQPGGTPAESVREFTDSAGREWRAWEVVPGRIRTRSKESERYLGEFSRGWLAFEALDGSARRRLPTYPDDWRSLSDEGLEALMKRAPEVPTKRTEGRSDDEPRRRGDA
jgi:hypothetical protein